MRLTIALLALLVLPACRWTIAGVEMTYRPHTKSRTMHGVEMSTRIVEERAGRDQRLMGPVLRKQLDRNNWMEYRLWARKSLARPFAPDLYLEVSTVGPRGTGFFSARDRFGNTLSILKKHTDTGRRTTETIQVVLAPKALQTRNNRGYLVYLRGEIPGGKTKTYEIELPSYYHRGFMNRYKRY